MAKILVVDDERMLCELLETVLKHHGHEVRTAVSGREGIEVFKQWKPRFALLDLYLQDMSGVEVLKQIRASDPKACVTILTGRATDDLENQARQLGATDFLRKGLSLDTLLQSAEKAMRDQDRTAGTAAQAQAAAAPEMESILVVDDDPVIRDLVGKFLALQGYHVREACDGSEALAMVGERLPHLIVLDVNMPGMDGVETLRKLRERRYNRSVIILTGNQDEHLLQKALDLGSVDVMGKPVDLDRLLLNVQVGCVLSAQ